MIRIVAFFCFVCFILPAFVFGQSIKYQSFDNFTLSLEANSVRLFLQDEQGLIWIGSNKGLYSFDGYHSSAHFKPGSKENTLINCGLIYNEDFLLLGTEKGILMYHNKYDKYVPFELDITKDIRAMVLADNDLWLGCADGLYKYHFGKRELTELFVGDHGKRKFNMVHALLEDDGYLYVGTHGSLVRFSLDDYQFEQIENPANTNRMIISLMKDPIRNCIWLGEGNSLTRFIPSEKSFQLNRGFPVVKAIGLDADHNVVAGTDDGYYVFNGQEIKSFVHDAQERASLASNIVWTVFKDHSGNLWLGTDNGFSFVPRHRNFDFLPIYQFTGTGVGNQFGNLFRDSKGVYWLGGDNGLISTRSINFIDEQLRWYKMNDPEFYIPHSHVRDIFEDSEKHLWIATDYGVGSYDAEKGKFTRLHILSGAQTTSWAYHIEEDRNGNLWISSFNGGIFKIGKKKLLDKQREYLADAHYSTHNGMNSSNIDQFILDRRGRVWALNRNLGLNIIDDQSGKVSSFPLVDYTQGRMPTCMTTDSEGQVWVGLRNGVALIDPESKQVQLIDFYDKSNANVLSLLEVENHIWCSSTEGLWVIDKASRSLKHIGVADKIFYGMYYDKPSNRVLLGGIDGIAVCSTSLINIGEENPTIIISSIIVNNNRYENSGGEGSVRYLDKIELPYNQNNIIIGFSDLNFSKENRSGTYVFKLDGDDDNWISIKANDNTIYLNKLQPGKHKLTIARQEARKSTTRELKSFQITIMPPWYLTAWAKIVYAIVLVGLVIWGINFFIQRNRLKFVQIEKEKTLEQSKMKIDFFTNIAHEFKTPLSLIIAPLSRLVNDSRNPKDKEALEMIQQNAMKLNSLVQQAIEYYRDNAEVPAVIILSRVEFVEFSKSIFSSYEENMKERGISFVFNSQPEKIEVDVDILKMESIVNNLLSNACKYSNTGDSIILSLNHNSRENLLSIVVSDTGIGIPGKDLPYVFQRFFQSPANKDKGGTGIGLYLVKNFAELHGGSVKVISSVEEGTSFTVQIPAVMNSMVDPPDQGAKNSETTGNKPLIVIVEDNYAIAHFVYNIFVPEFRCVIAGNGKAGLKICTELKPDVIIADIMMPVMDGLEMCRRLKQNIPTSTIPVVLLTAKDDKETELRSIQLKIDAFISKPFDSNILYSKVKQLIETQDQLGKKMRIEKFSTPVDLKEVSADEQFLVEITRIIEEHIANPDLNVNFLCAEAEVSQKQLYRKIKSLTGLTAVDYIKSIRMKKAAMLLANKNFTVAEVMYKVGFSSHSYFAKCFNAEFGKTPREFEEDN
jgi:signal transduction histidine kinase/ligand-binding sensor domain-containing protein/AraC-like DNA-binding protein